MSGSDPYGGRPPPAGFGAQITTQGGVEITRNLICDACSALIPDEPTCAQQHLQVHTVMNDRISVIVDRITDLERRYLIEEEPG